jgi:hypothetical protein
MLADEKCLRQFVMGEMLSQAIMLNQDELLPERPQLAGEQKRH